MIVVIAPEQDMPNELDILHHLFDTGLAYYHFRKPHKSLAEHKVYLDQVDDKYYENIIPHYFHELALEYSLKGVHLQEQFRWDQGDDLQSYYDQFKNKGFTVSSSYHDPIELEKEQTPFDYQLLSPVFSSISKQGYKGKGFDVNHINRKIVGMGGVNEQTIPALFDLGFNGVGVLGGIWNSDDPVTSFKEIQKVVISQQLPK